MPPRQKFPWGPGEGGGNQQYMNFLPGGLDFRTHPPSPAICPAMKIIQKTFGGNDSLVAFHHLFETELCLPQQWYFFRDGSSCSLVEYPILQYDYKTWMQDTKKQEQRPPISWTHNEKRRYFLFQWFHTNSIPRARPVTVLFPRRWMPAPDRYCRAVKLAD